MNPVGSKAKREELRRKAGDDDNWVVMLHELACDLAPALDGLDIAEKAMRAMMAMDVLSDEKEVVVTPSRAVGWWDAAEDALQAARAEWDTWVGS